MVSHGFFLLVVLQQPDPPADRVLIRQIFGGESLVDDGDGAPGESILIGERAAADQLGAERLVIAGRGDDAAGVRTLAFVGRRLALDLEVPIEEPVHRKMRCDGDGLHAGNGGQLTSATARKNRNRTAGSGYFCSSRFSRMVSMFFGFAAPICML